MSRTDVQPQLLLALLAFQNRFLDRAGLLAAFDAWSADTSRPIRELLLEQRLLSAEELAAVESLASRFLQRHAGNVQRSLQDVAPLDPAVRQALAQATVDPDLQTSLASLSEANAGPAANSAQATVAVDVGESTSQGTRFRILRPHARGGLGEVFVAEDGELRREVALKQMQARHADNERSRARFVLEAEITGGLEHPSIVPVYGLGTYADGRPFYAMRFIRGESFREAIAAYHASHGGKDRAARTLEFRKLLGRFVDMCDAIAYAHSRGVLHRDLKPDNVMLGKYGETLVVDWGLAKAVGERETPADDAHSDEHLLRPTSESNVAATRMGVTIGTPGYLSPEQATGRIDELGAATDIYSLGATLYHLLVNVPPITGNDLRQVLRRTERGEIRPPRQLDPRVPRGLEAICLKALATKPEDRYPSALALADDVEQWLADEPVSALREGPLLRLGRWMRKHRALVGSTAAAVVVVAAVAGVAAIFIERARREASDLAALNGRLASENKQLADTERVAKEQAERSAQEADEQRNLALDTLNALVYDVQDQLANRPGMQELKRRLLDTARTNLTKIRGPLGGGGRSVDRLSAAAMVKTGDLFVTLGSLDEAAKLYVEASDALTKLLAAEAGDAWTRQVLSVAQINLGAVRQQQGDLSAARTLYEQSLALRKQLHEENPTDVEAERDVVGSYQRLGEVVRQQGDLSAARKFYEQSLEITTRLAASRPDDRDAQRNLAISHGRLGDILLREGNAAAAETHFRRDWEISDQLAASEPDDLQAKRDLLIAGQKLGDALASTDPPTAKAFFDRGLALSKALAEADPDDVVIQRDLSIAHNKLGDVASEAGDWKTAREHFSQALELTRRRAEADPKNAQAQRDLSVAAERLGDVATQLNDAADSLKYYQQALEISEQLAAADPANAQAQRDLSTTLNKMGNLAARLQEWDGARHFYERSLTIRLALAKSDSTSAEARHDVMVSHYRLATVFQSEKKYAEAETAYKASIAVLEQMIAAGMQVERSKQELELMQSSLAACRKAAESPKGDPSPNVPEQKASKTKPPAKPKP
jgi:serine/threonine protein kinase